MDIKNIYQSWRTVRDVFVFLLKMLCVFEVGMNRIWQGSSVNGFYMEAICFVLL